MRNAGAYLLSVILVAAALSAVVSMATVQWLYPKRGAAPAAATQAQPPAAQPKTPAQASPPPADTLKPKDTPPVASQPQVTTASADEKAALEFIRKAAADPEGAAALAPGLTVDAIRDQVTRHSPTPQRVAKLPGPAAGAASVLVWTKSPAGISLYQVAVSGGKVKGLKGPLAPEGGYGPFALALLDEQAKPLDPTAYRGNALLLISPRIPEPGLADLLIHLQTTYAPQGITVALVLDVRSPDWTAAARAAGYKGPIWRVKARLEDVPLVSRSTLLGAFGVLVDRQGNAVASLAALEPLNYNLPDETPATIAPAVFRAYGLLP